MTEHDTFIRQICERPDDDTVRLVYADYLDEHDEPERAEFIRGQIEMARDWPKHVLTKGCRCKSCKRFRRLDTLARPRIKEWAGPVFAPCVQIRWYRGFIETIEIPEDSLILKGIAESIFAAHPITMVSFTNRQPFPSFSGLPFSVPTRYGWWNDREYRLRDTRSLAVGTDCIVQPIWKLIPAAPTGDGFRGEENRWKWLPAEPEAYSALSAAGVAFGRLAANLPLWTIDAPSAPAPT